MSDAKTAPPIDVLHVEVGGTFGGSLRALELYLRHADRVHLRHRLLLYYPTPGAERLRPLVDDLRCVYERAPGPARASRLHLPAAMRPLAEFVRLGLAWPTVRRLAAIIGDSGCRLVHCNNSFWYQPATVLAAERAGVPLAGHVRNPPPDTPLTHMLARRVRQILVLHEAQAGVLRNWRLPGEIACCGDGITLAPAAPSRAQLIRRHRLGQGRSGLLLGSLGRLEAQKGYSDLIAAVAQVLPARPDVHLVIFGEGSERPRLEALIVELGLSGRVHLPGFDPDPAAALAAMDLFVSSSHWEGLPLAVLEALLAGTPVVATAPAVAGEPRLDPYLAAKPAGEGVADLAAAIERALAAPGEARRRARDGGAWVAQQFSPQASARRLDSALRQAAAHPMQGRSFYEHVYATAGWSRDTSTAPASSDRFTKVWYRACLEHVLPNLELKDRTVLEVGCGYGFLLPALTGRGARTIGVEIAASALRQFPRGPQSLPVLADARHLPVADASCDLVLCMEVYEHMAEPERLVSELRRVVRPGGRVVLSCPNYGNLFLPLKLLADAGVRASRDYIKRQPLDPTLFAFRVRRRLARHFDVVEQRAIRLHPPLFERLDGRRGWPRRVNDLIFMLERRYGSHLPWRWMGLHTCFVLEPRHRPQADDCAHGAGAVTTVDAALPPAASQPVAL